MKQNSRKYSSQNEEKASKNLWIGELEQWMDSKYLIESCLNYSKQKIFNIKKIFFLNRYPNKISQNNPQQKYGLFHGLWFSYF